MHSQRAAISSRRADVDSLRVVALTLLIVYHVVLIYSGREHWRVHSPHNGYWADYLLAALTPWRMALVFLIGGIAVRFMLSRPSFGAFVRERSARLLTAFLFAVAILVPPQRFVVLDDLGAHAHHGYLNYLVREAPFVEPYLGLHLPQFAHAWFLPYLFAYSALAGFLWWFAPRIFRGLQTAVERVPALAWVVATMAWFVFIEVTFDLRAPGDRLFVTDWGGHAKFLPVFMIGVLIGKSAQFLKPLVRFKFVLWAAAATMLFGSVGLEWLYLHGREELYDVWLVSRGLYGGAMLWSVITFAHWALNRPSRTLTYASDAILPVYLMHQTALVVVAHTAVAQHWPLPFEMTTLFLAAALAPLVIYHVAIRHTPWLRFLFGLRPNLREGASGAAPPTQPVDYAHA
jgi:glucans biosynthesis protein C